MGEDSAAWSVGLETATEDNVTCCYAVQDKVWVSDPDQAPWEIYTVLADADRLMAGEMNGIQAFMTGKVRISGDVMYAQRMEGFFRD